MGRERQELPSRMAVHPPVARCPRHNATNCIRPRVDIAHEPDDVDELLVGFRRGALALAQEPHRPVDVNHVEAYAPVDQSDVFPVVWMIDAQLRVRGDGFPDVVAGHVPHLCQTQDVLERLLERSVALR